MQLKSVASLPFLVGALGNEKMNIKRLTFLLSIIFLYGTFVAAQVDTTNVEEIRNELNVVHRELSEALESRDVKRIRSFYSPSF
jgi:hypothetical protein